MVSQQKGAVTVQPLSKIDPATEQKHQNQSQSAACDWSPNLGFVQPHIDICEPLRVLVSALASGIRGVYQQASSQLDFLWQTPLQPFQDDKSSGLLTVWSTCWEIVLACLTVVSAYGALRYMLGSGVAWLAYANLAELIPRLFFGLLAAYFSKEFFILLIQGNNALAGIFNQNALATVINGNATGVIDESLQIVYGIMGFLLVIEEAARIAIIYLLFAFSPILFFFAALRETQHWAKTAVMAAIIFVFMQAVQSATLYVGGRVLSSLLHNTDGQLGFLNLLVSIAILYVTLTLFFSLARMALGHGAAPLGAGVLGASVFAFRQGRAMAGFVGGAAGAYRRARSNLFRLPGPDEGAAKGGGSGSSGGKNPGGSGRSGGQTSVAVKGQHFGSSGDKSDSSSKSPAQTARSGGSSSSGNRQAGSSPAKKNEQWQKTPPRRVPPPSKHLMNP